MALDVDEDETRTVSIASGSRAAIEMPKSRSAAGEGVKVAMGGSVPDRWTREKIQEWHQR